MNSKKNALSRKSRQNTFLSKGKNPPSELKKMRYITVMVNVCISTDVKFFVLSKSSGIVIFLSTCSYKFCKNKQKI